MLLKTGNSSIRLAALGILLALISVDTGMAGDFSYFPPGNLIAGSGAGGSSMGRRDCFLYAPGIFFPLDGPAFANSQVWNIGGLQNHFSCPIPTSPSWCCPSNFSYPWQDNFCEFRSDEPNLTACGVNTAGDHAGQDIRAATCEDDTYWVVSVGHGFVRHVPANNPDSQYVVVNGDDGNVYSYLHMKSTQVGMDQEVWPGTRLGRVSRLDRYGNPTTTYHLHFEVRASIPGLGTTAAPPYMSLVAAYRDMIGRIDVGDDIRATAPTEVRTSAGGATLLTTKPVGQRGRVQAGPREEPYSNSCAIWWLIQWTDGVSGWSVDNGLVEDAALSQWQSDGTTVIPTGVSTSERSPRFKSTLTDPEGDNVRLEIELRRLDEYNGSFLGTPTHQSRFVPSGSVAEIRDVPGFSEGVHGLIDGEYHWRARMVDSHNNARPWVFFGFNNDNQADFRVGGASCSASSAKFMESDLTTSCGGLLLVNTSGTGAGRIISSPVGIDCPGDCVESFAAGAQVLLSPAPSPGSSFAGWSGDSDCADGSVTMNGNRSCTATFTATAAAYTLSISKTGSGTVSSSDGGVNCGGACTQTYVAGTTVTLTASAASGWSFSSWSGNCSGGPVVQVAMSSNRSCTANFLQMPTSTPETTTGIATGISATSATLNGTVNPHGLATTAFFEYGPDPSLGNATPGVDFGAGNYSFFPYARTVTGLACATNYRFRAVGVSAGGDYRSSNNTFMTAGCPPAPCYALNLIASGDAPAPTASPTNSSGCPFSQFHAGEHITLAVAGIPGYIVVGWSGTDNDSSTATVNTATMPSSTQTVYVHFEHICYHLARGYTGNGTAPVVTNSVGNCPADYFPWGYQVHLNASPATGWKIGSWNGTQDDTSASNFNVVVMPTGNHTALVQYIPLQFSLQVVKGGNGTGTIVSDLPGINCGPTCSAWYPYGTTVTLTATPEMGSSFIAWSGECTSGVVHFPPGAVCYPTFNLRSTQFYTLTPCRVVDTRNASDPNGPALTGGEGRTLVFVGKCGIPATATAVSMNVTVVNASADGYLSLYPAIGVPPSTSTISFRQGQIRANNAIVGLNNYGGMTVFCGLPSSSTVDYIVDVNGYFQ